MTDEIFFGSGETHPCHHSASRTPSQEGNLNGLLELKKISNHGSPLERGKGCVNEQTGSNVFDFNGGETHPCHHSASRTPSQEGNLNALLELKKISNYGSPLERGKGCVNEQTGSNVFDFNGGATRPCHHSVSRTPSREGSFIWLIFLLCFISIIPSCKPDNLKQGAVKEYFDIKGYFEKSIALLQKQNKTITKTVVHNGTSESKKVKIANWKNELALFTESDINKPAWEGNYTVKDSAGAIIYTAKNAELRTRRIVIGKTTQDKINYIAIYNEVNNALYNTRETLNYFPDSAYTIEKYQKVKLLGANTYKITGKL